jgi:soluble lytic murein transglycosylase-like protein
MRSQPRSRCARAPGFGLIVALAIGIAWPAVASAQIFGAVRPNGAVVLTNLAGERRAGDLEVIVEGSPDWATGNSATATASNDVDGSRFGNIIVEAGRRWNVRPELLRAIIAVESKFNPQAVSKRGARGLMQLMPDTGKRFAASNLFDPRTNVLAGAQYLRALLDLFDENIELAVAAYNAGEQSVIKAGYRIPANRETRAYVPAVMARYRRLISE